MVALLEQHEVGRARGGTGQALAYTIDSANVVVSGNTVVAGDPYGPVVNYAGAGNQPILTNYDTAMFNKAGYNNIVWADTRYYHDGKGDIHCGTNVQRVIPTYNWWA